jgi:hypothetical protein
MRTGFSGARLEACLSPANFRVRRRSTRLVRSASFSANGGDFSIKSAPPPAPHDPLMLQFMAGEGQEWHGIDKLPLLAKARTRIDEFLS